MISIKCPNCSVGLKVDESKLPANIKTFNCPQCKKAISVSYVLQKKQPDQPDESETIILSPFSGNTLKVGQLQVVENGFTPRQIVSLHEGLNIIGRKSSNTNSSTSIITTDKLMSREHVILEVKKDSKDQYKHYLSDNKSKNRTLYNNNYLESGEVVVLKNNDEIQIGQTLLIFEE